MIAEIAKILEDCKAEIIENLAKGKINATHSTERSLKVVRYDSGVKLVLSQGKHAPLTTLETGSEPHWAPIEPLVEWTMVKLGLTGNEARSAAFAVQRKIAKKGTDRYTNPYDTYSTAVDHAIIAVKKAVADAVKTTIKRAESNFL